MTSGHSVTQYIEDLKKRGDETAAQRLYDRYVPRLLDLADKELKKRGVRKREVDEEDVVQSAFHSFCQRARDGKFPKLTDRENLWPLLIKITERKAAKVAKKQRAIKRGGGKVRGESGLLAPDGQEGAMEQVAVAPEPTPEMATQCAEEFDRLLRILDNDSLRKVAIRKMEGYTTEEIARELRCGPRTVKQKAALIRKIWEGEER